MRSCLLFICLSIVGSAFGQKFDYGIKGGPNLNYFQMDYEPSPDWINYKDQYESQISFHVGVFMSLDLTNKLSYRQEMEYMVKGGHFKGLPQFSIPSAKIKVSYLQFPVIFAYKLADRFFAEAGPAIAFHLSTNPEEGSAGWIEYINAGIEISALAGVRYTLSNQIDLQARYSLGLTNITDNYKQQFEDPDTGEIFMSDFNLKNRVVSLSALFYFKR